MTLFIDKAIIDIFKLLLFLVIATTNLNHYLSITLLYLL